jgi:hypothetical protein
VSGSGVVRGAALLLLPAAGAAATGVNERRVLLDEIIKGEVAEMAPA